MEMGLQQPFPCFSNEILRSKKTENPEKVPSAGESTEASWRYAKKAEETANAAVSISILVVFVPANWTALLGVAIKELT